MSVGSPRCTSRCVAPASSVLHRSPPFSSNPPPPRATTPTGTAVPCRRSSTPPGLGSFAACRYCSVASHFVWTICCCYPLPSGYGYVARGPHRLDARFSPLLLLHYIVQTLSLLRRYCTRSRRYVVPLPPPRRYAGRQSSGIPPPLLPAPSENTPVDARFSRPVGQPEKQ